MLIASEPKAGRRMPPPKGYVRKLISLPPALAQRVKDFRFRRRLENDTEAYRALIEAALDAADREDAQPKKGRRP